MFRICMREMDRVWFEKPGDVVEDEQEQQLDTPEARLLRDVMEKQKRKDSE